MIILLTIDLRNFAFVVTTPALSSDFMSYISKINSIPQLCQSILTYCWHWLLVFSSTWYAIPQYDMIWLMSYMRHALYFRQHSISCCSAWDHHYDLTAIGIWIALDYTGITNKATVNKVFFYFFVLPFHTYRICLFFCLLKYSCMCFLHISDFSLVFFFAFVDLILCGNYKYFQIYLQIFLK